MTVRTFHYIRFVPENFKDIQRLQLTRKLYRFDDLCRRNQNRRPNNNWLNIEYE